MQFCISYSISIMNSHVVCKTVWILISWLLKKPADLDLLWFSIEFIHVSGFILFFKEFVHVYLHFESKPLMNL